MKSFVLVALLLLPTALSAQVLIPSRALDREAAILPTQFESPESTTTLVAKRASTPDYKLRVIRPSPGIDARMPIGRPDPRIDYKILMPRDEASAPTRPRLPPKR